jgi:hypothetical protein
MIKEFWSEFKNLKIWQKGFFVLIVLGLVFLGLYHTGLVKIPQARAQDCSQVSDFQTIQVKMGDSFDPQDITARICDHLVFVAVDNQGRWPAVGPHPTHASYPGFDSLHDLRVGERFEIILNRSGKYNFHDHTHPEVTGTISIDRR